MLEKKASTKVNINNIVKCVLTEDGKKTYAKYHEQFKGTPGELKSVPTTLEIPLWEFCHIFGPELYMGNPKAVLTVDCEFEILTN